MAINSNSYGSAGEVGTLCPLYATGTGTVFSTSTRPTLAQVEAFIDQISAVVNVILAGLGFSIPITQVDAKRSLDLFVNQEAAHYAEYANGAGPFVPQAGQMRTESPQRIILKDAQAFLETWAEGLEALGATRSRSMTYGLSCREEDAAGVELYPPFDRHQVNHTVPEWDTS